MTYQETDQCTGSRWELGEWGSTLGECGDAYLRYRNRRWTHTLQLWGITLRLWGQHCAYEGDTHASVGTCLNSSFLKSVIIDTRIEGPYGAFILAPAEGMGIFEPPTRLCDRCISQSWPMFAIYWLDSVYLFVYLPLVIFVEHHLCIDFHWKFSVTSYQLLATFLM